jgi:regulator of protease activity HflC (stomatin/prohibitin superfamily)
MNMPGGFLAVIFVVIFILMGLRVVQEYERGVVLRLGRYSGLKHAGLVWLVPFLDKMTKVDLRVVTRDIPPQDVITKDNVSIKVNAVLYFRVIEPEKAILQVENFFYATSMMAQTTLRSQLGQHELDHLLADRDRINQQLQKTIDEATEPWGIKVTAVEVKNVDLPQEMQRAMAKQAEAEREKRAKIISAEGELQSSEKLKLASDMLVQSGAALQLRYLQTLSEIATEKNSTIIFPLPMELIEPFLARNKPAAT